MRRHGGNLATRTSLEDKIGNRRRCRFGKCAILALSTGEEWVAHGQPKRGPSRARGDVLSRNLRTVEYLEDGKAEEYAGRAHARTSQEIRSICHDVVTSHHERDYQALGAFLFPAIWMYLESGSPVLEIQSDIDVFPHVYHACPAANESMIFHVSRNGHMIWARRLLQLPPRVGVTGSAKLSATESPPIRRPTGSSE